MKGFALGDNKDVLIEHGEIQMVNGKYLTMQTIQTAWLTKKGEWFFDQDEGIERDLILGKKQVDEDTVRTILVDGLNQVDKNLVISDLQCNFDKQTRKLYVDVKVNNSQTGETLEIKDVWG